MNVEDFFAARANRVVVTPDFSVETTGGAGQVDPPDRAEFEECFHRPIHGRPRNLRNAFLHRLVNLVGRGVVVSPQNGFENHPPLQSDRNPLPTACLLECLEPCGKLILLHVITSW